MPSVLIVDKNKSSVVMSSEVFKDKIPGVSVHVARTGAEALKILQEKKMEAILVDFDLEDADGVSFYKLIRKTFDGPVFLSAFAEPIVEEAIGKEVFAYADIAAWVKKPIKSIDLAEKIERFIIHKHRLTKRFETCIETEVSSLKKGKGKTVELKGHILNLSLTGALLRFQGASPSEREKASLKKNDKSVTKGQKKTSKEKNTVPSLLDMAIGQKLTLNCHLDKSKKSSSKKQTLVLKASVVWSKKQKIGLCFDGLNETTEKKIEDFLRKINDSQ